MPKKYDRNCDFCGCPYVGQNALFCKRKCFYDAKSGGLDTNLVISDELHEVLEGVIFSDGNLNMQTNAYFRFFQSFKNLEYVEFLAQQMGVTNKIKERKIKLKGQEYTIVGFDTRSNQNFTDYYLRWYRDNKKIIPHDFKITPISLYHLYIGDGCLDNLSEHSYRVRIATCSFTHEEIEKYFVNPLSQLGIEAKINGSKNVIVAINKQSSVKRFMDYLGPNTIRCFDYKFRCLNDIRWLNKMV